LLGISQGDFLRNDQKTLSLLSESSQNSFSTNPSLTCNPLHTIYLWIRNGGILRQVAELRGLDQMGLIS